LCLAIALGVAAADADVAVSRASHAAIRHRVLELVNRARAHPRRCGHERFTATEPLTSSWLLDEAARQHAIDMAARHFFEHTGSDGSAPKDRLARLGYRSRLTGENIAYGPQSAEEVVNGWLASPGHCANIMEPRFREMGIALAMGPMRGTVYWVQDLAAARR
jgi:uncharacterized protein YkwD